MLSNKNVVYFIDTKQWNNTEEPLLDIIKNMHTRFDHHIIKRLQSPQIFKQLNPFKLSKSYEFNWFYEKYESQQLALSP